MRVKRISMTKREYLLHLEGVVVAFMDMEKGWRMGLGWGW